MLVLPEDVSASSAQKDARQEMANWIMDNRSSVFDHLEASGKLPRNVYTRIEGAEAFIFNVEIIDIDLKPPKTMPLRPILLRKQHFVNNGSVEQQQIFTYEEETQSTFSFSFTESVTMGAEASAGFSIKLIDFGVSLSVEVGFEANQEWTETESQRWSESTALTIPPHTELLATSYINEGDLTVEFSARVRIVSSHVLLRVGMVSLPKVAIPLFLNSAAIGFPDHVLEYPVRGTLQGNLGIESAVDIKTNPLLTA